MLLCVCLKTLRTNGIEERVMNDLNKPNQSSHKPSGSGIEDEKDYIDIQFSPP